MPAMQVIQDADGDSFHLEEVPGRILALAVPAVPYCELVVRHPSGCAILGIEQALALRDWLNAWLGEQGQEGGDA